MKSLGTFYQLRWLDDQDRTDRPNVVTREAAQDELGQILLTDAAGEVVRFATAERCTKAGWSCSRDMALAHATAAERRRLLEAEARLRMIRRLVNESGRGTRQRAR